MGDEDLKYHATRIAQEVLDNLEFCNVYEDEELEEADEDDLRRIHNLIVRHGVVILGGTEA